MTVITSPFSEAGIVTLSIGCINAVIVFVIIISHLHWWISYWGATSASTRGSPSIGSSVLITLKSRAFSWWRWWSLHCMKFTLRWYCFEVLCVLILTWKATYPTSMSLNNKRGKLCKPQPCCLTTSSILFHLVHCWWQLTPLQREKGFSCQNSWNVKIIFSSAPNQTSKPKPALFSVVACGSFTEDLIWDKH